MASWFSLIIRCNLAIITGALPCKSSILNSVSVTSQNFFIYLFIRSSRATKYSRKSSTMSKCLYCKKDVPIKKNCLGKYCDNKCQGLHRRQKLFEAIVKTGQGKPKAIKAYLIATYGDKCMDPNCAWNNAERQVKCELEHKDGNSQNNTLENCTLLCPNCHSLTPTYKSKNKGNGRHSRRVRYANGQSY